MSNANPSKNQRASYFNVNMCVILDSERKVHYAVQPYILAASNFSKEFNSTSTNPKPPTMLSFILYKFEIHVFICKLEFKVLQTKLTKLKYKAAGHNR